MTGKRDIISDGENTYYVDNGDAMMGCIVGTGCMAASVIGSFSAVERDHALASAAALGCYGIAGELAAEDAKGPGAYKSGFYDAVSKLNEKTIKKRLKVENI
jgi:hydroxyethylthiazole kinase